eukprot:1159733-Pelagomonas_calceolata.AAC.8
MFRNLAAKSNERVTKARWPWSAWDGVQKAGVRSTVFFAASYALNHQCSISKASRQNGTFGTFGHKGYKGLAYFWAP